MADESCADCRFFVALDFGDGARRDGTCRRMPPLADDDGDGYWPTIASDLWCGEFSSTAPGPAIPVACRDALCSRPHTITDDGVRYHPHDYD